MGTPAKVAFGAATLITIVIAVGAVTSAASTGSSSSSDSSGRPSAGPATGAAGPQATAVTAKIADFAFSPEPITVKAGGTVTWTNDDPFAHTVKAKDATFDSADLVEGATFRHTFSQPGSYPYICGIHNSMTGTVVVLP